MTYRRTDRRTDGRTDRRTGGGDCNIPDAFLKKRGDKKIFRQKNTGSFLNYK